MSKLLAYIKAAAALPREGKPWFDCRPYGWQKRLAAVRRLKEKANIQPQP